MIARALVSTVLRRFRSGMLVVHQGKARHTYGEGPPTALITLHSPRVWRMLLRGSLGLAEAYEAGMWDSPDLVALIRVAARNAAPMDRLRKWLAPLRWPIQQLRALVRPSSRRRSRRYIAAHYELGHELFSRMLDPTMTYSCAFFGPEEMTLEEAQIAKLELICQKLELGPDDRLLEIGTGWGSLAIHAAATRGCHVTTATISREQHAYVFEQVRRAGLQHRVTVLLSDYRDLRGSYDKLVSVEMIEAVGWRHNGTFFATCSRLLAADGAMLLQAITMDDQAYEVEKAARSFMNQRIFPGGSLPSLQSVSSDLARRTDLRLAQLEDITPHYVTTLRSWREKFIASERELAGLGYDERFRRIWMLYLAYCEAGFAERRIRDVQLLLTKPGCTLEGERLATERAGVGEWPYAPAGH